MKIKLIFQWILVGILTLAAAISTVIYLSPDLGESLSFVTVETSPAFAFGGGAIDVFVSMIILWGLALCGGVLMWQKHQLTSGSPAI